MIGCRSPYISVCLSHWEVPLKDASQGLTE